GNGYGLRQVEAPKYDSGIGRGRAQAHVDLVAAMQADTGDLHGFLQSALSQHVLYRLKLHDGLKPRPGWRSSREASRANPSTGAATERSIAPPPRTRKFAP